jgi:hypothetical protein
MRIYNRKEQEKIDTKEQENPPRTTDPVILFGGLFYDFIKVCQSVGEGEPLSLEMKVSRENYL